MSMVDSFAASMPMLKSDFEVGIVIWKVVAPLTMFAMVKKGSETSFKCMSACFWMFVSNFWLTSLL